MIASLRYLKNHHTAHLLHTVSGIDGIENIWCLSLNSDSTMVAYCSFGELCLVRMSEPQTQPSSVHLDIDLSIEWIGFHPCYPQIIGVLESDELTFWDILDHRCVDIISNEQMSDQDRFCYSSDGLRLFTINNHGNLNAWDISNLSFEDKL